MSYYIKICAQHDKNEDPEECPLCLIDDLQKEVQRLREELDRLKDVGTAAYFCGFNRGRDGSL